MQRGGVAAVIAPTESDAEALRHLPDAAGNAPIPDRRATDAGDTRDDERRQQALARCHRLAPEACGGVTTTRHKQGERLPTADLTLRTSDCVVTEHRPREWR